jgi:hypothetical protein
MGHSSHTLPVLPLIRRIQHNLRASREPHGWRAAFRAVVGGPSLAEKVELATPDAAARVRVMRWIYRRAEAVQSCELALANDASGYQIAMLPGRDLSAPAVEWFRDVGKAFRRQSEIEGELIRDGWSLESYESLLVERPAGIR